MRTVLLTLVLGLAVAGCTDDDPGAAPAPERTRTATSERGGAEPGPASTEGPLQLEDSRGKGCASLRYGREYTAWEHVLEPDADVTISGWSLVGATNVEAGRGFVAELPSRVPATGFTLGFPPGPDQVASRRIDWEHRRPAAGATLDAGSRSNFWVRIRVVDGVRRAGYRGLLLRYAADGREYTALSDIRMQFRGRCR